MADLPAATPPSTAPPGGRFSLAYPRRPRPRAAIRQVEQGWRWSPASEFGSRGPGLYDWGLRRSRRPVSVWSPQIRGTPMGGGDEAGATRGGARRSQTRRSPAGGPHLWPTWLHPRTLLGRAQGCAGAQGWRQGRDSRRGRVQAPSPPVHPPALTPQLTDLGFQHRGSCWLPQFPCLPK